MRRFSTLRGAAALLAIIAAAACDTPTASPAARTPAQTPARFTLSAPTGLSVTNSGGYPLVSWTAPAGATSYKVSLINYNTVNGAYQRRFIGTLATVTSTSYLDTANPWTGSYMKCDIEGPDGNIYGGWYEYQVIANYPTGSSLDARIYAPIGDC
ncbi:hypothetical protein [Longimicrobium sp.]|uniref:hypothetical protein n=1 Tax=Longimicrobium sp. TaxID=2029185 RepID=UPI002D059D14|nr:hypothetical protein [Longimicrobium sp.]HSU13323.1 hypothetical protein [Longimicrobium sp.]